MGADVLNNVNAMPAPTWHRLDMNETAVELPEGLSFAAQVEVEAAAELIGEAGAFDAAVAALQERVDAARAAGPADTRAILKAVDPDVDPADLDIPALVHLRAQGRAPGDGEQRGRGVRVRHGRAGHRMAGRSRRQGRAQPCSRRPPASAARLPCASPAWTAPPTWPPSTWWPPAGATFDLTVSLDSPAAGSGVVGVVLRVFAGENAHVNVTSVHTLDETWMALDDTGIVCDEGAFVTVRHRMLGAGKSYTGLGHRPARRPVARGRGHPLPGRRPGRARLQLRRAPSRQARRRCNIDANGALMGESKKVLRGTIDLVRGCKGAEGTERETVLLVDERVDNKTIPVILCDEDDVAGNHGATIGHVAADQLFYLKCRGLSQEAAEGLFATATLEETALAVEDETVRAGVGRLAGRLGIPYQEVEG